MGSPWDELLVAPERENKASRGRLNERESADIRKSFMTGRTAHRTVGL